MLKEFIVGSGIIIAVCSSYLINEKEELPINRQIVHDRVKPVDKIERYVEGRKMGGVFDLINYGRIPYTEKFPYTKFPPEK